MSKKNFKTSFDDLISGDSKKSSIPETKQHMPETKATFVIRCDQLDQLKAISYMERKMIKEVLGEALSLYITKYESDNGRILLPKNK